VQRFGSNVLWGIAGAFLFGAPSHAAGDVERGAQGARACMACHSFAPGQHMTGPSLAGVWGRQAGTADGFGRYSDAVKRSAIVWDKQTLDAWLRNPSALIPGNAMVFDGIADPRTRGDLPAYLQAVSEGRALAQVQRLPNLKIVDVARQVSAIRYCGDAYRVVTGDRKTHTFWEFNLRFKTDGSPSGPLAGKPVVVGTGMQGRPGGGGFLAPRGNLRVHSKGMSMTDVTNDSLAAEASEPART